MRLMVIAIAAALGSAPAWADAEQQPSKEGAQQGTAQQGTAQQGQTSDARQQDPTDIKGYGYGEQPGREANASARQAGDPSRATPKTPQDQRPEPAGAQAGEARSAKGARHVEGRVVKVDGESLSLSGEGDRVRELRVTKRTKFLRDGKSISAAELSPGDEVRASFVNRGTETVATRVTVVRPHAR